MFCLAFYGPFDEVPSAGDCCGKKGCSSKEFSGSSDGGRRMRHGRSWLKLGTGDAPLDFWPLFQNRALPSELGRVLSHLDGNNGILDAPLTPPDVALCSKTSPRVDESAYCVNGPNGSTRTRCQGRGLCWGHETGSRGMKEGILPCMQRLLSRNQR